ncbi:hypothetical protein [Rhodohalobacter sulfatireducens]|uniref:Uncharacterized protein n=1 Tax=Rhodohalobacter sulfatireducens TaxID=2911366 RepID=A0ABS9KDV8_9BACT|nr:hypothetical protein [Rhodohalobacter sulfatireducens]MCG2589049.1 hypothetical protein [Rhodohalobacter sulfatireducens]
MNKNTVLTLLLFITACRATPDLREGLWTGTLTPMNHPEMENPINYEISYPSGSLSIDVISPDSSIIPTRNVQFENDTLYFQFDEPEEQVTLNCALGRMENLEGHFSGRCTDPNGQWAYFMMVPPE